MVPIGFAHIFIDTEHHCSHGCTYIRSLASADGPSERRLVHSLSTNVTLQAVGNQGQNVRLRKVLLTGYHEVKTKTKQATYKDKGLALLFLRITFEKIILTCPLWSCLFMSNCTVSK